MKIVLFFVNSVWEKEFAEEYNVIYSGGVLQ